MSRVAWGKSPTKMSHYSLFPNKKEKCNNISLSCIFFTFELWKFVFFFWEVGQFAMGMVPLLLLCYSALNFSTLWDPTFMESTVALFNSRLLSGSCMHSILGGIQSSSKLSWSICSIKLWLYPLIHFRVGSSNILPLLLSIFMLTVFRRS